MNETPNLMQGPGNGNEKFTPEQVRNYMMAGELSLRIGDNDNADKLYRDIGREKWGTNPDWQYHTNLQRKRITAELDPAILLNFEKLMRKIIRWLTAKEQWENQMGRMHGRGGDQHIAAGLFDVRNEPEFKEIVDAGPDVYKMLGVFEVELKKKDPDHPYEPVLKGFQLAASGDKILFLRNAGSVFLVDKDQVIPVVPEEMK